MLAVDEARSRILDRFSVLQAETVPLAGALGRVVAADIRAPHDVPGFANSSMDGFAVRSADIEHASQIQPVALTVSAFVPAGSTEKVEVTAGTCARVMTGAPLPDGADAVIPFEDVDDRASHIVVPTSVTPGACVRPAGNDMRTLQTVLPAGVDLSAPRVAVLAALGCQSVDVRRRPRVAVLATGDELVPPGSPLRQGQIYDSNTPMIAAAIEEAGGEATVLPRAADTPEALAEALQMARGNDLLLTTGGASVGDFDYVKEVVGRAGDIDFWRVRMRPGKPLLYGVIGQMPVLGLPGNPTSAFVTFEQFARPAIRTMLGAPPLRPVLSAVVDDLIDNRGGRRTYARVTLRVQDGEVHARLAGGQDSAMLLPLARADGLLIVPEDREEMQPGDRADVQVWHLPQ